MVRVNDFEYQSSEAELRELIDTVARARLAISGDELIRRYRRGALSEADRDEVVDLLALVDLLPDESISA